MNCRCITMLEAWAVGLGPESIIIGIVLGILGTHLYLAWKT